MVSVAPERLRNDFFELGFHLVDGLARREAGAIADPEDMRVDREGLLAKSGVEDHIGGLAADARKLLELFPNARDFASVALDQSLAERNDVLGLGIEKADRLDCYPKIFFTEINHLPRRCNSLEDRPCRDVDAGIGRLRRKHDCDEQRVGIGEIELGGGRGVCFREPMKEFEYLIALHSRSSSARPRRESASSNSSVGG